jgi:hypothetical protein
MRGLSGAVGSGMASKLGKRHDSGRHIVVVTERWKSVVCTAAM